MSFFLFEVKTSFCLKGVKNTLKKVKQYENSEIQPVNCEAQQKYYFQCNVDMFTFQYQVTANKDKFYGLKNVF